MKRKQEQGQSFCGNRVLYFHKANDYTGSTRALASVIGLQNATVITITPSGSGLLSDADNIKLVPICYIKIKGHPIPVLTFIISYISRIYKTVLYSSKFDCFYINTIAPFYAAIIGTIFHKRIIYHVHEKIINPGFLNKICEFVFIHTKSDTIYVSEYLKSCYPLKTGSSRVVFNVLPYDFIRGISIRALNERGMNVILMVSSLSREKGVYDFLKLAALLPEYNFVLVLSVEEEIIDEKFKNIPSNVKIFPKQKCLAPFYHESDLLLNLTKPSLCIETFGLTILEAMAYGVPSIVPNVGGPTELVQNDYNGYCVNVERLDLVVDSIKKALCPQNYNKLAANSISMFKKIQNNENSNTTFHI